QRVLRLPRVLPEVRLGVADLDAVVVNVEVDPVSGLSLDDDGVVAGVLQIRPEEAVGLRRGRAVGERADRDDGETARAPHGQTGLGALRVTGLIRPPGFRRAPSTGGPARFRGGARPSCRTRCTRSSRRTDALSDGP